MADPARFEELLAPHCAAAQAFARSLCRSRAEGDDLFQTAVLRALDKFDSLRDEAAFKPWLFRILVSAHRSRSRRAFWWRLVPFASVHEPRELAPGADEVLGGAARARLALSRLPADQREAIVLFEIDGWTVEEIAAMAGVSLSAVKSRLARGRSALRVYYVRQLGAPADAPAGELS